MWRYDRFFRNRSLSARRAWIEIAPSSRTASRRRVALRKESVDRNKLLVPFYVRHGSSLSARRAWIEIQQAQRVRLKLLSLSARRAWIEISVSVRREILISRVALRKESVDRNCHFCDDFANQR